MTHRLIALPFAIAALLFGSAAIAATKYSEAQLRYQQDRALCMSGSSNQDRATCLREAGAALQEARRGNLSTDESALARNRMVRCDALPAADREDCAMRMRQGTTAGTAQQGGIIREVTRPVPTR